MIIKSKKKPSTTLGLIFFNKNIKSSRQNLCDEKEYLQVSIQVLKKNFEIISHKHIKLNRNTNITQEMWLIMKGKVELKIFDLNNQFLKKFILKKGDFYILFRGGHKMKSLVDKTEFYEIKNGPYFKNKKDIKYFN